MDDVIAVALLASPYSKDIQHPDILKVQSKLKQYSRKKTEAV
jgi:hypothetical protein